MIEPITRDNLITTNLSNQETSPKVPTDFSKIKVGLKKLEDAVVNMTDNKKSNPRLSDKREVLRALENNDLETLQDISNYFFKTSGIYSRLCRYMAFLYRYDWMLTPYINNNSVKQEKVLTEFNKILKMVDSFGVKKNFGEIALKVIKNGRYYGYIVQNPSGPVIQELPNKYCRTRYSIAGRPAIEINMKFFDDKFRDATQRQRVLDLFPKEFKKGYIAYKQGRLPAEYVGDSSGWWLLDPECAFKINNNGEDFPMFASVIPAIIDLDDAQELDRKKMAQKLVKIIIQKMPLDKNGDLIFDVDEARELHNSVVAMLSRAIGVDVLTTFADVDVADLADNSSVTSVDELDKVERTVYNEAGVSQLQFNTNGNIALEKSILNDEATMYNLLLQFEELLNRLIKPYNKNPKKVDYRIQMLTTTIYNYKDLAKLYEGHTKIGYSKILPQVALGHSQSSILASAHFENKILNLNEVFVPPMSSNTMSAKGEQQMNKSKSDSDGQAGRKELDNDKKSEKTIMNRESMS